MAKKKCGKAKLKATRRRGNNKSSPKLRPRRRASQTYFFKYQLARNPLKAEEEDLKLALLASLQCASKQEKQQSSPQQDLHENNHNLNNKQPKKENHSNHQQPNKQQKSKHPPPPKQPTPPVYDEEYLKRYRPETEDFLTFICFRVTAPNFPISKQNELSSPTANGSIDHPSNLNNNNNCSSSSSSNSSSNTNTSNNIIVKDEPRRPIRQSPRLASSSKKISEFDSSNPYTAYYNHITYEEDIRRAQIALEDMANGINGSEGDEPIAQPGGCISPNGKLKSPFKNNKHLVKKLMTREFAGAFADEEIIFESIKNHKSL